MDRYDPQSNAERVETLLLGRVVNREESQILHEAVTKISGITMALSLFGAATCTAPVMGGLLCASVAVFVVSATLSIINPAHQQKAERKLDQFRQAVESQNQPIV